MRKLMLEIDALRVESFATTRTGVARLGTVRAHSINQILGVANAETEVEAPAEEAVVKTELCSLGCSEGCSIQTCPTGIRSCCV